jgi:hypothetical protein
MDLIKLDKESDAYKQLQVNPLSYKVIMDRLNRKALQERLASEEAVHEHQDEKSKED